jgi:hypothetical protein
LSSFYILDFMLFQRFILNRYSLVIRSNLFRFVSTTAVAAPPTVQIEFKDGLAHLTVPLPSRNESCVFQVKHPFLFN